MDVILMILGGVAFGALGVSFGYQAAMARERKSGGGRTASELRTELDDYQQNVSDHFMESAALLQGMTEQYKKVYEHMARGAQELCDTKEERPELAALRNGLLAAALATSTHEDLVQAGKVLEAQASGMSDSAQDDTTGAEEGASEDQQEAVVSAGPGAADAIGQPTDPDTNAEEDRAGEAAAAEDDAVSPVGEAEAGDAEADPAVLVNETAPEDDEDAVNTTAADSEEPEQGYEAAFVTEEAVGAESDAEPATASVASAPDGQADEDDSQGQQGVEQGWAERFRAAQ